MRHFSTLLIIAFFMLFSAEAVDFNKSSEFSPEAYAEAMVKAEGNLYVVTDKGLLKSSNEGETWVSLENSLGTSSVNDIAVDASGQLVAATESAVMVSNDEGFTWTEIDGGLEGKAVTELLVSAEGNLFAGTDDGAFKFDANAESWAKVQIEGSSSGDAILALETDAQGNILVSGSKSGINISSDEGETFAGLKLSLGASITGVTAIGTDGSGDVLFGTESGAILKLEAESNQATEVKSSIDGSAILDIKTKGSGELVVRTENGIFSSSDGETFASIDFNSSEINSLEITAGGKIFVAGDNEIEVSSDGFSSSKLEVKYDAGALFDFVLESNNSIAVTAEATYKKEASGWAKIGAGIDNATVHDVAMFGSTYFAATSEGVFKFETSSKSWTQAIIKSKTGAATKFEQSAQGKALVATKKGLLISEVNLETHYIVDFSGSIDIDDEATDVNVNSSGQINVTNNTSLYVSSDEGQTWENVSFGLGITAISAIEWQSNDDVYIGTLLKGMFKSTDAGSTWVSLSGQFLNKNVLELETANGKLFAQTESAVFYSNDGGSSWTEATSSLDVSEVLTMQVSSSGNVEILTEKGIFVSFDGNNWTQTKLNISIDSHSDIAADASGKLYLAAGTSGLFVSDDEGESWMDVSTDLEGKVVTSVKVGQSGNIFVGTDEGLYISTDGGAEFNFESNTGISSTINEIELAADGSVVLKYDGKAKIKTGANSWKTISVNGNTNVEAVNKTDAALFASLSGNVLFKSEDEGSTWTEISSESESSVSGVISIESNLNGDIVAATETSIFLKSEGSTEDISGNIGVGAIAEISLTSNGELVVSGENGVFKATLGSSSYTDISGDLELGSSGVLNLHTDSNGELTVVTEAGVSTSANADGNWEKVEIDLADVHFSSLTITEVEGEVIASSEGGIFISNDFGATWSELVAEGRVVLSSAVNASGEIFTATEENGFLKLSSSGEVLADLSAEFSGETVTEVASDANATIVAASETIVKVSNDAGATWTEVQGNIGAVARVMADAAGDIVVTTESNSAYMINVAAKTATELNIESKAEAITGFATDASGNILIATEASGIVKSSDNGSTFAELNSGLTSTAVTQLTSSLGSDNVYALTADGVFQLNSESTGWVKVADSFEGQFSSITDMKASSGADTGANQGLAEGDGDVLIISTAKGTYTSEPLSPASVEQEVVDKLIKVNPNPTTHIESIVLDLDKNASVELSLYNSQGQKITAENYSRLPAGISNIDLKTGKLMPGNYFLQAVINGKVYVKRIVIMR